MGAKTSLVRSAEAILSEGPRHTLDLARDVLGLRGHPGASAAAIFQLLGGDPRFQVDGRGVWTLDPALPPLGVPLDELGFAVVDVETTGGRMGSGHRILEIAIVEVQGGRIVDEYQTLVNPVRGIPPGIVGLTGITDAMVAGAPEFAHVADEVLSRLERRVFVAHNVAFDWAFVSRELLDALGDVPELPRLCTVRMVRRLVPGLRHRNLDVVARHFRVQIHARHRAHGDALATARVLLRLLDEARGLGLDDLESLRTFLGRRRRRRDPRQMVLELEEPPGRASGGDA